jgi:phytanoyl-CoA hydroxylase
MPDQGQYRRDGFLLLPGLFDGDSIAHFESRFLELVRDDPARPPNLKLVRDVEVARGVVEPETALHGINKLMCFEDDPLLFAYATDERLLGPVREIVGEDLTTLSTNVFNKPPGVDARHPLHQDLRYFTLRPADGIVASWTAISPTTRENGCLAVVPGSHRGPLQRHVRPDWEYVNSGFYAAEGIDLDERVHIEMAPGDTLLFHPLLLHGSGRNRTRGFRRAISTHFASTRCTRPDGPRKREPVMKRIEG